MRTSHKRWVQGIGVVLVLSLAVWVGGCGSKAVSSATLENLQAAYNGESNAQVKYEAFAKKADEEGYAGVASLFRAASMAEGIHKTKHGKVIKDLGAEPKADIGKPEIKSTRENVEAALKGESYERDTMYPDFIKKAEAEKNKKAIRTFKGALAAEVEHAKLYKEALDNLDAWKSGPKEFLVCQVCGFTTADPALTQCPVCNSPRDKIQVVK